MIGIEVLSVRNRGVTTTEAVADVAAEWRTTGEGAIKLDEIAGLALADRQPAAAIADTRKPARGA